MASAGQVQIEVGSFTKKAEAGIFDLAGHAVTLIEIVLAGFAIVFFFLMLILAGVLNSSSSVVATDPSVCSSPYCRVLSGQLASYMNESVNPCDNFQEYACGKYYQYNTLISPEREKTVYSNLYNKNTAKIENLLTERIRDYRIGSYERKVKQFFTSCTNDYQSNKVRGEPLILALDEATKDTVYLWGEKFPSFDNFNFVLQKVHIDYWTDAFFTFFLTPNSFNRDRYDIQISSGGLGMNVYSYIYPRRNVTQHYKNYMTKVLTLLAKDKGVEVPQYRIDAFWDDVYAVEYQLANISLSSQRPDKHPHLESELKSLSYLNLKFNNIDFVKFFKNIFGPSITPDTKVIIAAEDYLLKVNTYINMLTKKNIYAASRMLTNYMTWRLIQRYATYLSYDYVHANREYYQDVTGRTSFPDTFDFCFRLTTNAMRHALGALFVKDHFSDSAQRKAVSVVQDLRTSMVSGINQIQWMDGLTKQAAIKKINSMTVKIGYPKEAMNTNFLNDIYADFEVSRTNFFGNVLNWNKYLKNRWSDLYKAGKVDRSVWRYKLYDVHAGVYNPWHEIMVPAGMLQYPLFSNNMPHYVNYGAIGVIMAHELINSVDEIGGYYTETGKFGDWWTKKTTEAYKEKRMCTKNYYANMTAGPYTINDRNYEVPMKRYASSHTRFAIAETGGIQYAFKAYKNWVKKNGAEQTLLGTKLTPDQSFFVSYAQTNCFNRNPYWSYFSARRGNFPEDMRGNGAMAQSNEFAKAFKCPVGSPMNAESKCNVF